METMWSKALALALSLLAGLFPHHHAANPAHVASNTGSWTIDAKKTFSLPSECVRTHSLSSADGYIFGSIWSRAASSCIWRLNPSNGKIVYATSSVSGVRVGGDRILYDKARDTLYAIETNPATYVLAINPETLSVVSHAIPVDEPAMSLPSMTSDGSYFYVVNNVSYPADSLLYKISMADYSVVATSSLPAGNYHAITYDGRYLYMSTTAPDAYIVKADTDLNVLDVSNPARAALCSGYTNDIAEAGDYVYLGCEFGFYGVRIKKDNFEKHSLIYVGGSQFAVIHSGQSIVYGTYSGTSSGRILVVNPNTLTTLTVTVDDGSPNEIIDDGARLFAAIWKTNTVIMFSDIVSPGGVKKPLIGKK